MNCFLMGKGINCLPGSMQEKTESISPEPMKDDTGLLMQMVIPKEMTRNHVLRKSN